MNNIADLSQVRHRKEESAKAAALQTHEEVLAYIPKLIFPGEQILDQATQQPTLTGESELELTSMFRLFGVSELSPLDPDFDLVTETWYQLTCIVRDLEARVTFKKLYATMSGHWHPDYVAYVNALWDGDRDAIARGAKALNIQNGVPEGATRLQAGPMRLNNEAHS